MIAAGLAALVIGGDLLVRGAVDLARRLGVSPLIIGLTLVGFGTSTPELVTSLQAAFVGSPGIAIGNVVGSNIANILLILGIAALIAPMTIARASFQRDGLVLAASALLCLGAVLYGALSLIIGLVFVAGLLAYVAFAIISERRRASVTPDQSEAADAPATGHIWKDIAFVLAGLLLTIFGARWLVSGAIDIAASLGVSETIVGLTVVAVGTSLPELVTSFAAARRGQSDIAFGNIVGSNIFNVLFILGVTALVHPIAVPPGIASFDIWVMLGATALLILFACTRWRISRMEGGVLFAGYVAYTLWLLRAAVSA